MELRTYNYNQQHNDNSIIARKIINETLEYNKR